MAEVNQEREIAPEQRASADATASAATLVQQERVSAIIGQANAAMASGNQLDLESARFELDGAQISSAEAAVVLSFVSGVITETQARQSLVLVQQAQPQTTQAEVRSEAPAIAGTINVPEAGGDFSPGTHREIIGTKPGSRGVAA